MSTVLLQWSSDESVGRRFPAEIKIMHSLAIIWNKCWHHNNAKGYNFFHSIKFSSSRRAVKSIQNNRRWCWLYLKQLREANSKEELKKISKRSYCEKIIIKLFDVCERELGRVLSWEENFYWHFFILMRKFFEHQQPSPFLSIKELKSH